MATILIAELLDDLAELLAIFARRLGHVAIIGDDVPATDLRRVDVVIAEPACVQGADVLWRVRREQARPAVVISSIYPRDSIDPIADVDAWLLKPYGFRDFESALRAALQRLPRRPRLTVVGGGRATSLARPMRRTGPATP